MISCISIVTEGFNTTQSKPYGSVNNYLRHLIGEENSHVTVVAVEEEVDLVEDIMSAIGEGIDLTFGLTNMKLDNSKGKIILCFIIFKKWLFF